MNLMFLRFAPNTVWKFWQYFMIHDKLRVRMFRLMVIFVSCFRMSKAHGCWKFPTCRALGLNFFFSSYTTIMEGNCCYFISHGAHLQGGDTEECPCLSRSCKDQSWTNLGLQVSVKLPLFFISVYLWECESHIRWSSNLLLSTFKFLVTQLGIWCNLINVLHDLHQTFFFLLTVFLHVMFMYSF